MTKNNAVVLAIAFAVAITDGVLKFSAHRMLTEGVAKTPIGLALHRNEGIAFNIPVPLSIVLAVTVIVLIALGIYAQRHWHTQRTASIAAIVIIVGALGNAADRAVNNFTTDYLIFFGQSAINLSDVLIVIGTCAFLYYTKHTSPSGAQY